MALVTGTFQDCLLNGEISGVMALNVKLLEALGYKVMMIKYTEWPTSEKLVTRVKLLDDKFKKLIAAYQQK